jgi:hypothetical protein
LLTTSAVAAGHAVDAGPEGGKGAEWQMVTKGKAKARGAKRTTIRVRPSPFIVRDYSGPYYHCNRYGHKQASCTSYLRCAICSKGYHRDECTNKDSLKCPACGDALKTHELYKLDVCCIGKFKSICIPRTNLLQRSLATSLYQDQHSNLLSFVGL